MDTNRIDVHKALDLRIQQHYATLCQTIGRESLRIHLGYTLPNYSSSSLSSLVSQILSGNRVLSPILLDALNELLQVSYEDIQLVALKETYEHYARAIDIVEHGRPGKR